MGSPDAFDPKNWEQRNALEYLLSLHTKQPFEIIKVPFDPAADLNGGYGDDWN